MKPRNKSLAVRLKLIRHAVDVKDIPNIRDPLLKYGYNDARFEEGEDLYNQVIHYDFEQNRIRNEQIKATFGFRDIYTQSRQVYTDNVKVARVALRGDRTALQKLELTGLRKKEFSQWLSEVKAFYNGAMQTPEILHKLSRFGLNKKVLKKGLDLVKDAETAREKRNRLKADAQDATKKRDEALHKAEWWRSDLVAVARVSIKGPEAQYLEVLDLTIPAGQSPSL
ncbi:MAG: hypothetical protein GY950_12140 [bacterium]|nr:hypothetical protein [bacterium]